MRFSDWTNSLIVTKGNHDQPRSIIKKAMELGLCGLMAVTASVSAHNSQMEASPLSYEEFKSNIGVTSKRITEMYSDDKKVIVMHTDENLRLLIADMKPGLLEFYQNPASDPGKMKALEELRIEEGYAPDDDQFKKIQLFTDLTDTHSGAFAAQSRPDEDGRRIAFFKGWSSDSHDEMTTAVPYSGNAKEQKYFTFLHEITHLVEPRNNAENLSTNFFILKSEAIADVATAMIMLRETGNLDEYKHHIRAFRLAFAADYSHMTPVIADPILNKLYAGDLQGVSDRAIMLKAAELVDQQISPLIQKELRGNDGKMYSEVEYMQLKNLAFAAAYPVSEDGKPDEALYEVAIKCMENIKPSVNPRHLIRDTSRDAIISSINSLIYHNDLKAHTPELIEAINKHIRMFDDMTFAHSLSLSTSLGEFSRGEFDPKSFVDNTNTKLDTSAFYRKAKNQEIMSGYFEKVTGTDIETNMTLTEFKPNTSSEIGKRYANNSAQSPMFEMK